MVPAGVFTAAGIVTMFQDLFSLTEWHFQVPLLLDVRELEPREVSPEEWLDNARKLRSLNAMLAFTRLAVILRSPESVEKAKRVTEATGPAPTAEVKLFDSSTEALNWLVPAYSGSEPKVLRESGEEPKILRNSGK